MRRFLQALALGATALAWVVPAQAGTTTLDFDAGLDTSAVFFPPFLVHGDFLVQEGYGVGLVSTKAGAQDGDLVGALIDGADVANTCSGVKCPTNNATQFLGMVNDGLPYLFRLDGALFGVKSFDAGFIAAALDEVPPAALLMRVYGFLADGSNVFEDAVLPGPSNGVFSFNTYTFSDSFAAMAFEEVDFYGYACNTAGSCSRANNKAQFALDNIVLDDFTQAVPEPGSLALVGLAMAGLVGARRRRQASA